MTRLAVVADVHADDYGSKVDPATGLNARFVDTIDMLRWVASDARTRACDALIVAGDLTEQRHPAPWRVDLIRDAIDDFAGPTILLRGNHDGIRAGRSIVDVLAAGRPGWHGFSRPGITVVGDVAIAALPYLDATHLRVLAGYESIAPAEAFRILGDAFLDLARGLYVDASELAPERVLVVHQGLAGGNMSDVQRAFLGDMSLVVDTRALGAIGFDAILAGHFHLHQILSSQPLIAYAGSPYRNDFGEEHQTKGYLVVDVDGAGVSMAFVETPARRFVTIDWSTTTILPDVLDAVVRVLNVDAGDDVAEIRRLVDEAGAFDVGEIRRRPVSGSDVAGGLSEGLTPEQALEDYFADEDDRDGLVERGRELLQAVA